jgi:hypothetical protein
MGPYVSSQRVSREGLLMAREQLLGSLEAIASGRTELGDCISLGANNKTSSVKGDGLLVRATMVTWRRASRQASAGWMLASSIVPVSRAYQQRRDAIPTIGS